MADMLTLKLLINSVVSTPNAKFMAININNFHLNMPLTWYKYLQQRLVDILKDAQMQHKLKVKATEDIFVYI